MDKELFFCAGALIGSAQDCSRYVVTDGFAPPPCFLERASPEGGREGTNVHSLRSPLYTSFSEGLSQVQLLLPFAQ